MGQERVIFKHVTYSLKIPGGRNGHPLGSCATVADTRHQLSAWGERDKVIQNTPEKFVLKAMSWQVKQGWLLGRNLTMKYAYI